MKVLQINSVCGKGSIGRIAVDLADVLKVPGHECKIAYGRDTPPDICREIAVRIGSDWDVRLHGAATRLMDAHGFASKRATARFLDWVRDYDPDLIHLHNIHGYYLNVELLFEYLKQACKPIVWTLHDCWGFTGHCVYYTIVGCDGWQTGCNGGCPQKRDYPKCLGRSAASENFRRKQSAFLGVPNLTLVTPSRWLAGEVRRSFLGVYPVEVIPNGIDLMQFRPTPGDFRQRHGLEGKRVLLGVANIWDARKGLSDFLELAKLLEPEDRVVLVGLSLRQMNDLPPNVLGLERTNNVRELAEIYTMADVFINPSVEETMGMTTLEALACGTPVLTYDRTAVPEVADTSCGVAVSPGVQNLLDALDRVHFPAEACRKRAEKFDKWKRFGEYLELYQRMVGWT